MKTVKDFRDSFTNRQIAQRNRHFYYNDQFCHQKYKCSLPIALSLLSDTQCSYTTSILVDNKDTGNRTISGSRQFNNDVKVNL